MEKEEKRNAKISDGEGIEKRRKLEIVGLEDRFYLLLIPPPPPRNQTMDQPFWNSLSCMYPCALERGGLLSLCYRVHTGRTLCHYWRLATCFSPFIRSDAVLRCRMLEP